MKPQNTDQVIREQEALILCSVLTFGLSAAAERADLH